MVKLLKLAKMSKLLKLLIAFFVSLITYHISLASLAYAAGVVPPGVSCWDRPGVREGDVLTLKALECIFENILGIAARLAGLAVFVMLILGGWQYITSGGEKEAAKKAKNTLTYAVLGLVLLIGSWFILRFIKVFTGVEVTNFVVVPD